MILRYLMINIKNLRYSVGGHVLLDQANAVINAGHKVGLIGRNGSGKTTLFKLILEEVTPDSGEVTIHKSQRIATVAQDAPSGKMTLIASVLAADTEMTDLQARSEISTDPNEIAAIHTRLADIGAQTAPTRAARILSGLGFDEELQQRSLENFSGGWRMRVALAATLFSRPDILLLDEPSNHLDLEACLWLESYLASWRGTLIVISHDRTLLNETVSEIIHLDDCKLTRYSGSYDDFERLRRERQLLTSKLRHKQNAERQRIESFVNRFRYKATKARQAQSRLKLLEKMQPIAAALEDQSINFSFPKPKTLSPPLINLDHIDAGYHESDPVLHDLDLRVDMDDRIGLLGANGNGKSTLIKILSNRLTPMQGQVRKSSKLRVGYFAQDQTDELNMNETAFVHASRLMPKEIESKVRGHIGRFGFSGDKANTLCINLSGGERAKLLFALMCIDAPHILLLDEPTNHLDVDAREALIQALNLYEGAVIIVSHDSHLLDLACERFWLLEDKKCSVFDGDLQDYRYHLIEKRRKRGKIISEIIDNPMMKQNRKSERRARAEARAETANLRKSIRELEKKMDQLAAERDLLESELADPAVYEGPTTSLMQLQVKLGGIKVKLERIENEWMQKSEELELAK